MVYVGRYGHQAMDRVDCWARSTLVRRAKLLEELLKAEADQARMPDPAG